MRRQAARDAVTLVLLALALVLASSVRAEVTGFLQLGNHAPWRGLSVSDRRPTMSGNVYQHWGDGTYLGVWLTLVDFQGPPGADPRLEVIPDLGRTFDLGGGHTLSVGIQVPRYPHADPLEFVEPYFMWARCPPGAVPRKWQTRCSSHAPCPALPPRSAS